MFQSIKDLNLHSAFRLFCHFMKPEAAVHGAQECNTERHIKLFGSSLPPIFKANKYHQRRRKHGGERKQDEVEVFNS